MSSNAPPALQVALKDLQAPPPQFGNQPTSGLDGKGKGSRGGRARIAGGVSRDVGFTRLRLCARDPAPVAGYVSNVKGREVSICLLRLGYCRSFSPIFADRMFAAGDSGHSCRRVWDQIGRKTVSGSIRVAAELAWEKNPPLLTSATFGRSLCPMRGR